MRKFILLVGFMASGVIAFCQTFPLPVLALTPFTQIEKTDAGTWRNTGALTLDAAFLFSVINGKITPDQTIPPGNLVYFGGGVNFGVKGIFDEGGVITGTLPVTALVGYKFIGAGFGVDAISGKPLFLFNLNLYSIGAQPSDKRIKTVFKRKGEN